ncbi:hypothetical protein [Methanoculleus sp. UBA303]|nr:hypothetical protein [Methanoculleus sp. UBA303]
MSDPMAGDALPRYAVVAAASLLIGACITLAVAPPPRRRLLDGRPLGRP